MSMIKEYLHWVEENEQVFQQLAIHEEWKPIPEAPLYEVSNWGRVRSYVNNKWGYSETPHLLIQTQDKKGYWRVGVGRGKQFLTHRLVAEAFIPNPDNLPTVLHNNSNPDNCEASNLRWGTQSENIKQGVEEGSVRPERARAAKLEKCVSYSFTSPAGDKVLVKNLNELARTHNLSSGNLSAVVKGERKQHKGWRCEVCQWNPPKKVEAG